MDLGQRLKLRRLDLGLTLEEVGSIVNVSKSTVMKWENGDIENMKRDKIILLGKALKVSPLWIMGLENTREDIAYNTEAIPLLGTIAAGTPILAQENIENYFNIDSSIHANFALRVKGESMIKANINNGDIVFIRQQCVVENREIAAVLIDGEATLKRVLKIGEHITLLPENDDFDPIILDEKNDVRILGKMVASLKIYN